MTEFRNCANFWGHMGISYYELIFFHLRQRPHFLLPNFCCDEHFHNYIFPNFQKILFCMHLQLHISHKKVSTWNWKVFEYPTNLACSMYSWFYMYFSKECMNLHNDNMRKMTTDFTKKNHCRKLIPFNLILFILLVDVLFDIENTFLTTKAAQKSVVSSSSILKDSRKKMVL